MIRGLRSTTRLFLSRLVPVSVCLCALTFLPPPQCFALAQVEEKESPEQDDGERSEEEQVVYSSTRRRLKGRRQGRWPVETLGLSRRIASYASRLPTKVGHQLEDGCRAPLLI